MEVLKVLVRYLKHEVEDSSRMDDEIISSCLVLFDEKESFFRNHKIEIIKESTTETGTAAEGPPRSITTIRTTTGAMSTITNSVGSSKIYTVVCFKKPENIERLQR